MPHITTVHTLAFAIKCAGNDQQLAALAIIKTGAANMGLTVSINNLPLPDGEDHILRSSMIQAMSAVLETCESYWEEVQRALTLIGVESTSP